MAERAQKEDVHFDEWVKDIAPSAELRTWFNHDPKKWEEFKRLFFKELHGKRETVDGIVSLAKKGTVTLLFASKEERFNNAVALKEYVEARMSASEREKAA